MPEKSDKQQLEERILEVSRMMLSGIKNKKIVQDGSLKWNISDRQVRKYITKAYAMWHEEYQKRLKAGLNYHMAIRMQLYEEAYKGSLVKETKLEKGKFVSIERMVGQDFRLCLEIAKDIAKLEGLYVEKHDVKFEGELKITDARKKFVDKVNNIIARTGKKKTT
jgi:hypothetical protein